MTIERPMFPPRDSSRRAFLTLAAGTGIISVAGICETVAAQAGALPGSDAMLDRSTDLASTFAALVKAKRAYDAAEATFEDWEAANPAPMSKKGRLRWTKRAYVERLKMVAESWQDLMQAEREFAESLTQKD